MLLVVATGLLVHPYRAQQASRYALTAAIVEQGTVALDDYEGVLGIDRALRDGRIYSDKAPGQPFLMVPFFAAAKAVGAEEATTLRIDGNLGVWWLTLWSAAFPAAVLALMMHRRLQTIDAERATIATASIMFGTLLLPFAALLFGHVMAAAFLFGAYLLAVESTSAARLAVAGLLAGMAVSVEYTVALGVAVLGMYLLFRLRGRVIWFVLGGIPIMVLLGTYNTLAFGGPWTLSYQFSAFSDVSESARPMVDMFSTVTLDNAARLLLEGRGLLIATPVVLLAVFGAVWRLRGGFQVDAAVALAMFSVFLLLPLFWGNPWGGDSPGPRYLTPALPFLAVPLAWAYQRVPRLTAVAATISVVTMVTATVTNPLIGRHLRGGLSVWMSMATSGELVETIPTMLVGPVGWVLHLGLVPLVVGWLLTVTRRTEPVAVEDPPKG